MTIKKFSISRLILTFAFLCNAACVSAIEPSSLIPEIHGTFRGRFEYEPDSEMQRFQVRNARVSVSGQIAEPVSYFFQADFCDKGKFKMLDAYGRLAPDSRWKIMVGQMRIPFSIDASRQPHAYIFANRSFIGKYTSNFRGVGAKFSYSPEKTPLYIEAGLFNTATMANHDTWQTSVSAGAKARYTFGGCLAAEVGFESLVPDSIRWNAFDVSLSYQTDRWLIEGEYVNKHYSNSTHATCHAYNFMGQYSMPVKAGIFNRLAFQTRFDGMTDHSDGYRDENRRLVTTQPRRNRLTIGSTLAYLQAKVRCEIRLNYEQYFYPSHVDVAEGNNSKLVAELVIRF